MERILEVRKLPWLFLEFLNSYAGIDICAQYGVLLCWVSPALPTLSFLLLPSVGLNQQCRGRKEIHVQGLEGPLQSLIPFLWSCSKAGWTQLSQNLWYCDLHCNLYVHIVKRIELVFKRIMLKHLTALEYFGQSSSSSIFSYKYISVVAKWTMIPSRVLKQLVVVF